MPSLVENGRVVLEKKTLKFRQCILPHLGKGRGPSIEQNRIPFTKGCFVPSLVEISPVVLEKKIKYEKFTMTTTTTTTATDNGQTLIRKAQA